MILLGGPRGLIDGQGDDVVDGALGRCVRGKARVGEGDEPRALGCAEQRFDEVAPSARGTAVECLRRQEGLLAYGTRDDGCADHRQAVFVLLDDGVDAAGDARAGGNAPVGVEDDRDGKREGGDGAHAWSSEVLGVAEVFSPGAMASR